MVSNIVSYIHQYNQLKDVGRKHFPDEHNLAFCVIPKLFDWKVFALSTFALIGFLTTWRQQNELYKQHAAIHIIKL